MLGLRACLSKKEKGYGLRKCLKCDRPFGSEHVGNRICLPCKQADKGYHFTFALRNNGALR